MPKNENSGSVLAVVGSRGWTDSDRIFSELDALAPVRIVSGGAVGVDTIAENWARARGVPCEVIRPDYATHGRAAPHIRNKEIVFRAQSVIAFWDGKSRGTVSTIEAARRAGKNVTIIK